ncbi:helix-turn-helix domain-containing protein [Paenibacillus lutimineralis]|uniref:AraC family transcriptional regulator n=1 Tax=Paenibacillus lutimineralis TaxID=2707005 RepID=A0A3Q9ICZ9_9BACL|nr:AraC family transcriptional regulator [Paenibacillus lutimineralis]AZS17875.1 AraC family transcriptional regulator [Paenibacillus lutimineralis]
MRTNESAYLMSVLTSQTLGWENIQVGRWPSPEQAISKSPGTKHLLGVHCSAYYENYYTIHIIPAGEPMLSSWGKASLYFLQIEIPPSFLERVARESGFLTEGYIQLERKFYVKDPKLLQLGLWMLEELKNEGKQGKIYIDSLSNMLAVHLLSHYSKVSRGPVASRITLNQDIYQTVEYMKDHLEEELSIQELADRANLSLSHYTRLFKQQTGHTPHHYLIRLRIEHSKSLICQGEYGLREIADRAGFADQGHFTRMFKRLTGMTPKQYTQEVTGNRIITK